MINKIIKLLLRLKLRLNPVWCGASFGIDERTDVHVLVERWISRSGATSVTVHMYGTRIEETCQRGGAGDG